MKIHNIQNINVALEYLKRKDVKLVMISAEGMWQPHPTQPTDHALPRIEWRPD